VALTTLPRGFAGDSAFAALMDKIVGFNLMQRQWRRDLMTLARDGCVGSSHKHASQTFEERDRSRHPVVVHPGGR
jgi:hypothetical protein